MSRSVNGSMLAVALLLFNMSHAKDNAQDIADVQHVMDTFHHAVVTHDGAALAAPFIPEGRTIEA